MKIAIHFLYILALAIVGIVFTSCNGDSNAEADKAAAAYYEEKFNADNNGFEMTFNGPIEKWEVMESSRKTGVKGKVMTVIIGFFHQKSTYPIGKYFKMYNDGKDWKVLSMSNGAFLTKEQQLQFGVKQDKDEIKPQFGPQEQAALDNWLEEFAQYGDNQEKYGEFLDCFIESGSGKWVNQDRGNIVLVVCHEKKSTQHSTFVEKQEDGSWKAID